MTSQPKNTFEAPPVDTEITFALLTRARTYAPEEVKPSIDAALAALEAPRALATEKWRKEFYQGYESVYKEAELRRTEDAKLAAGGFLPKPFQRPPTSAAQQFGFSQEQTASVNLFRFGQHPPTQQFGCRGFKI